MLFYLLSYSTSPTLGEQQQQDEDEEFDEMDFYFYSGEPDASTIIGEYVAPHEDWNETCPDFIYQPQQVTGIRIVEFYAHWWCVREDLQQQCLSGHDLSGHDLSYTVSLLLQSPLSTFSKQLYPICETDKAADTTLCTTYKDQHVCCVLCSMETCMCRYGCPCISSYLPVSRWIRKWDTFESF